MFCMQSEIQGMHRNAGYLWQSLNAAAKSTLVLHSYGSIWADEMREPSFMHGE